MNRIWMCLWACLMLGAPLHAQLIRSFGVKAAYTSSFQKMEYTYGDFEADRLGGFNAGAFVEWLDLPFVSVVTQVEYAQRGRSWEMTRADERGVPMGTVSVWERSDYLSVPVMGKLRLSVGNFSPYVEAGPRIDYFLGYKNSHDWHEPIFDDYKKWNIGGAVALGSELHAPSLPLTLSLEARYNFDLADSYASQYLKVRNNSFDIWLGVGF